MSEAGDSLWTLLRAQPPSLRWRRKCGWEPKSRGFRLSQALANQVVRKGVGGDFILCGLSPPVSADWSLVHRYTFGPPITAIGMGSAGNQM